jgi:hypothetical protein
LLQAFIFLSENINLFICVLKETWIEFKFSSKVVACVSYVTFCLLVSFSYIEKFTDFLRLFVSVHLRRIESYSQFPVVEFLTLLFKYTFHQVKPHSALPSRQEGSCYFQEKELLFPTQSHGTCCRKNSTFNLHNNALRYVLGSSPFYRWRDND